MKRSKHQLYKVVGYAINNTDDDFIVEDRLTKEKAELICRNRQPKDNDETISAFHYGVIKQNKYIQKVRNT